MVVVSEASEGVLNLVHSCMNETLSLNFATWSEKLGASDLVYLFEDGT